MTDQECTELLQWAAPRLHLRWRGFRRVRGQVCKRIARRMAALGLGSASAYRERLERDESEWAVLDSLCRVTISRFYRDRAVWDALASTLLPELIARERLQTLRCWSAGCASGEEPFTLAMLFRYALLPRFPDLKLALLATDADVPLLERARVGCYRPATLRELPEAWKRQGFFVREDGLLCVRPELREVVEFACADVRTSAPAGPLHLLLCRNVVFTYFDEAEQARAVERFADLIPPGGFLVLGAHEESFPPTSAFVRRSRALPIYVRV